ncbi:hypothetical protein [Brachybacterium sp.]|jgi:hypothetical protein|uniref:hypothetical protein n=1 Tax=Brachybacterium sp. TaxID=1891286 RepID=UPI002ED6970D
MDLVALLLGLLCFGAAVLLAVAAAWFRWGRSRAARWWAAREPVEQRGYGQAATEALALWLLPYGAQLLAFAGLVALLWTVPWSREHLAEPALWTVVIAEVVLGLVLMVVVRARTVLPIWSYPGWLRPQRGADRERLRAIMRQRRRA